MPKVKQKKETPEAKYQRLSQIYQALVAELEALETEGRQLRHDVQTVIDKQKMEEVLRDIVEQR